MTNDQPPVISRPQGEIKVEFTPLFVRFLKYLAKKYRHVQADLQTLIDQLERGETPGDQVKGTKHAVYKVRLKSTDIPKGKSGGYRVIYYLKTATRVVLLAMYVKTEQADVPPAEIRRMIEDYEQQSE